MNICRESDGITVDTKKAEEFVDYYAAQDNKLQTATLNAAKQNPGGSLDQWKEAGLTMQQSQGKTTRNAWAPRTYERIELASTSEGLSVEEWI